MKYWLNTFTLYVLLLLILQAQGTITSDKDGTVSRQLIVGDDP
jgi:hypothetical protein